MFPRPYIGTSSEYLDLLIVIVLPAGLLLCWLFNAYRMGKFKEDRHAPPNNSDFIRKRGIKRYLLILCGFLLGALICLTIRFGL